MQLTVGRGRLGGHSGHGGHSEHIGRSRAEPGDIGKDHGAMCSHITSKNISFF